MLNHLIPAHIFSLFSFLRNSGGTDWLGSEEGHERACQLLQGMDALSVDAQSLRSLMGPSMQSS